MKFSINLGILTPIMMVLKLCHVINWSWWVVFLPLYGPVLVSAGAILALSLMSEK